MAHLKDLERQLMALKKQIPFATARALTSTARKIQEAQKDDLQSRLDNPTPFTVNSVASKAARKTNLNAKVLLIRPTAAEYLAPEEFCGTRHLGGKALLNPKGVRLNKYGNLPKGKLSGLKANPNVFAGSVDGASGFWQRKKYQPLTGKKKGKRSLILGYVVQDSKGFAAGLMVEQNAKNPSRVDVLWDGVLINQLRIFAVLAQFRLQPSS